MTENEAIDKLNNLHYKIIHTSFCNKVYESEIEALCMTKDVLQEIQQYKAIGTIEEFKALKDYKELYDVYRNIASINEFRNLKNKKNVLPIATIKISKEDMQKMVDEKMEEIELDIQKIRANAIDEFAEKCFEEQIEYDCPLDKHDIEQIAQQLKAGGKNE